MAVPAGRYIGGSEPKSGKWAFAAFTNLPGRSIKALEVHGFEGNRKEIKC
jgi:hypothetical protein